MHMATGIARALENSVSHSALAVATWQREVPLTPLDWNGIF